MNEFDIIAEFFAPLATHPGSAGLHDDAAVLNIPPGHELVVTSDTLNANIHFLDNENPDNIARKALRVNLSDLAAMAAAPYAYQLCVAFSATPDQNWLKSFSQALQQEQQEFKIFCSGGDTTSTSGPLSISITALGLVPAGKAIRRGGARAGDILILTGPIGDAVLGLNALKQNRFEYKSAILRHQIPLPRNNAAPLLQKYARAAIDISDGLVADIGHICTASNVSATLDLPALRFSRDVRHAINEKFIDLESILTGGDDYELALAVPANNATHLTEELKKIGLDPLIIGRMESGLPAVRVLDENGKPLTFAQKGWTHF